MRVTDDFMYAVLRDGEFSTRSVKDGHPVETFKAREMLQKIADATWHCGDPGMQYDTTVNRWHTSKNTARINASNPCSEYMFLDDSACNLAVAEPDEVSRPTASSTWSPIARRGRHDHRAGNSGGQRGYPTEAIGKNSHDYRPLGLGYANLGALLMARACPTTPMLDAITPPALPPSCAARRIYSRPRSLSCASRLIQPPKKRLSS